jgi:hypothetical protein
LPCASPNITFMYPKPSSRERSSTETLTGRGGSRKQITKRLPVFVSQLQGAVWEISVLSALLLRSLSNHPAISTRHFRDTHSCVEHHIHTLLHHALFIPFCCLLPPSCLSSRPAVGGPSSITATVVPRVKVLSAILVQPSLLLHVFTNRTVQMYKRSIPRRLPRLLQVPQPEESRDCC